MPEEKAGYILGKPEFENEMDKTITDWLKTDIGIGNDPSPMLAYLIYDSSEMQSINSALDKYAKEES